MWLMALVATCLSAGAVDISPSERTISQDFNSMYNGTAATLAMPADWRVDRQMNAPRTVGDYASAQTTLMYSGGANLASNASNGTWNWGSSTDASDRAVGGLSTTVSGGTRCVSVMTKIHNAAEVGLTMLTLNYDIEKYRDGSNAQGFVVQVYTSPDGSVWTSAGDDLRTFFPADAATAGAANVPISTTAVTDKALKVDVAAGADFYIAWNISVAAGTSPNQAMGLAIDNVSIDATFEGERNTCYIYAEDVTKWPALQLRAGETVYNPGGTAVVNGVTYKYFELERTGQTAGLTFTDGGSNSVSAGSVTLDGDHYFCVTAAEATPITDPATYTGWVDPDRKPFVASGIYLRGEVNGWGASADWEFSDEGNGTYVLYDKELSGNFKVADASWSSACNYGTNGTSIQMGVPYTLVSGTNDNISCGSNAYACSRIVLTINGGVATLLLEANDDPTGLTAVYVMGDNNGWNYMDTSGKLDLTETAGQFEGQVTLLAGADGMSHWLIYQHLGMAGPWGAPGGVDATGNNLGGTLQKGSTATVSTTPGTYIVRFNLITGAYELEQIASQPVELALQPAEVTLVPTLPEQVKVLSLNNSLIYYNDQDAVFNGIAEAMGKDAHWTKHTLLGKPLSAHWEEGDGLAGDGLPGAKMLVRSDAWSHIILQEQSALPRTGIETFRNNVRTWRDYIREYCPNPNAVIILPLNWAYSGDWSNFTEFNRTFLANYLDVARDLGVTICPVGLAYQMVYDFEGETAAGTWFLDDRHPTAKATYMAACLEYATIFGADPATITWHPTGLTDTEAASMRQYAAKAANAMTYNPVVHTDGIVRMTATLLDQFGMPIEGEKNFTVSGGGTIGGNGVFISDGTPGTFDVTATSGEFTRHATITVAEPETEVVTFPAIELNAGKLTHSEDFNAMGTTQTAAMPTAWRIDRQTSNPRTLGRYDMADETTMYSGGVNLPSNAKNGTWNFGDNSGADRAPGGITTGVANATRCVNVYAHLKNTERRKALEHITISYDVEKYRKGSNAAGFDVQLYYSIDGRNWTSAGSEFLTHFNPDSETAGYDVVPGETVSVSSELDINMPAQVDLYLAWNITLAANSGSANAAMALAIDNFNIEVSMPEIPTALHYIYADDQTGWDALGLYAWGDSELFGTWPGETFVDEVEIGGITFKKFLFDTESGNFHLIFNNWNNGLQLPDYDVNAGSDYYFRITPDRAVQIDKPTALSDNRIGNRGITLTDGVATSTGTLRVVDLTGRIVRTAHGSVSLTNLPEGMYIITDTLGNSSKVVR